MPFAALMGLDFTVVTVSQKLALGGVCSLFSNVSTIKLNHVTHVLIWGFCLLFCLFVISCWGRNSGPFVGKGLF